MKPSIGRIVHFRHDDGLRDERVSAAMISGVNGDGSVDLTIFSPCSVWHRNQVVHSDDPAHRGSWFWPPREDVQVMKGEASC